MPSASLACLPTGRQIRLTHGDQELIVVEVGGGIRTYRRGDADVIDGYAQTEMSPGGRGQVLVPWPNRVGDGRYEWEGQPQQLAQSEPEHHNAIHGLARWSAWSVTDEQDDRATLSCRLYPQQGWLWVLDLSVTYTLSDAGLTVRTAATNQPAGAGPCPFGAGWHPYLAAFGGLVDDALLTVPATTVYTADDRGLPTGTTDLAGTNLDFRSPRPVGPLHLDHAFTGLSRRPDGRAVVELAAGDGSGRATRLWMDGTFTHVMVFSGDTLGDAGRRRRGLAVEPMTCPPDMLRSGIDRLVLEEGGSFAGEWGLEVAGG
jgi:aldose 1-epimerase